MMQGSPLHIPDIFTSSNSILLIVQHTHQELAGAVAAIDDYRAGRALPACPAVTATPPEEAVA